MKKRLCLLVMLFLPLISPAQLTEWDFVKGLGKTASLLGGIWVNNEKLTRNDVIRFDYHGTEAKLIAKYNRIGLTDTLQYVFDETVIEAALSDVNKIIVKEGQSGPYKISYTYWNHILYIVKAEGKLSVYFTKSDVKDSKYIQKIKTTRELLEQCTDMMKENGTDNGRTIDLLQNKIKYLRSIPEVSEAESEKEAILINNLLKLFPETNLTLHIGRTLIINEDYFRRIERDLLKLYNR